MGCALDGRTHGSVVILFQEGVDVTNHVLGVVGTLRELSRRSGGALWGRVAQDERELGGVVPPRRLVGVFLLQAESL